MADCSKTLDFILERERMCNFYKNCEGCPATDLVAEDTMFCAAYEEDFINDVIKVVQKWSDEHPVKKRTYADDFFEKFPKATRYRYGEKNVPSFCIDNYYALGKRSSCGLQCHSCWNEPYEVEET